MRDFLLVLFTGFLIMVLSIADSYASSHKIFTCTDSSTNTTVQVDYDQAKPMVIYIDDFQYDLVSDKVNGDNNTVKYDNYRGTLVFTYALEDDIVTSIALEVQGKIVGSNYTKGTCL